MNISIHVAPYNDTETTEVATVEASCVLYQSGAHWRSSAHADQHGMTCAWSLDDTHSLNTSILGALRIDSDRYLVTAWAEGVVFLKEREPRERPADAALFSLGRITSTPAAIAALERSGQHPMMFALRHQRGDWGAICEEDKRLNAASVSNGTRILSAYDTALGERLWVITEADRSSTTVLLPEEY